MVLCVMRGSGLGNTITFCTDENYYQSWVRLVQIPRGGSMKVRAGHTCTHRIRGGYTEKRRKGLQKVKADKNADSRTRIVGWDFSGAGLIVYHPNSQSTISM